ncbi:MULTISPECIES: DUF397 domain-containing protein [unclassified Nocardia]|uniref:DUF397 domain-containing protein n=1 Tax=unclassified Nocardia TaxID=2637762 RepID=UPI001CE49DAA|nr:MULTISPECIES: DUF397 domain-containing protein [unclassified Nocardia]
MSDRQISIRSSWFKSSFSKDAATCVEIRFNGETVLIRDSKYDPTCESTPQPIISVPASVWPQFTAYALGHRSPKLDALPSITVHPDGGATISSVDGISLTYTSFEWAAFIAAVEAGEFALIAA